MVIRKCYDKNFYEITNLVLTKAIQLCLKKRQEISMIKLKAKFAKIYFSEKNINGHNSPFYYFYYYIFEK